MVTASVLPLCAVLRRHAVPKRDWLQPYSCPLASRKAPPSQPGGRSRDVTRDYGAVIKSATNYHHTACESPPASVPVAPEIDVGLCHVHKDMCDGHVPQRVVTTSQNQNSHPESCLVYFIVNINASQSA